MNPTGLGDNLLIMTIIRKISDITGKPTSHGVGQKKVLLTINECISNITQIASTTLESGAVVEEHKHLDMEECFLIRSGEVNIAIEGESYRLTDGDFIYIPCGKSHRLNAVKTTTMITIGCKI